MFEIPNHLLCNPARPDDGRRRGAMRDDPPDNYRHNSDEERKRPGNTLVWTRRLFQVVRQGLLQVMVECNCSFI